MALFGLLWITFVLLVILLQPTEQSECTFRLWGTTSILTNNILGEVEIKDVLEISFDLKLDLTCFGYCHILAIGSRYPLLYTLKPDSNTDGIFRSHMYPYDEQEIPNSYDIITDKQWHSLYFKYTKTQNMVTIDGDTHLNISGDYRTTYLNQMDISAVWYGFNQHHALGSIRDLCVKSYLQTSNPTPSPSTTTYEPSPYPSSASELNPPSDIPTGVPSSPTSDGTTMPPFTSSTPSSNSVPSLSPFMSYLPTRSPTKNIQIYASLEKGESATDTSNEPSISPTSPTTDTSSGAESKSHGLGTPIVATLVACAVVVVCVTVLYVFALRYMANNKKKVSVDQRGQSRMFQCCIHTNKRRRHIIMRISRFFGGCKF